MSPAANPGGRGAFSNVMDREVKVEAGFADGTFSYSARGAMVDRNGKKGAPFSVDGSLLL